MNDGWLTAEGWSSPIQHPEGETWSKQASSELKYFIAKSVSKKFLSCKKKSKYHTLTVTTILSNLGNINCASIPEQELYKGSTFVLDIGNTCLH